MKLTRGTYAKKTAFSAYLGHPDTNAPIPPPRDTAHGFQFGSDAGEHMELHFAKF